MEAEKFRLGPVRFDVVLHAFGCVRSWIHCKVFCMFISMGSGPKPQRGVLKGPLGHNLGFLRD